MKFTIEKLERVVILVKETLGMSSFQINKLDILKI
jgi:hypothetical protein